MKGSLILKRATCIYICISMFIDQGPYDVGRFDLHVIVASSFQSSHESNINNTALRCAPASNCIRKFNGI